MTEACSMLALRSLLRVQAPVTDCSSCLPRMRVCLTEACTLTRQGQKSYSSCSRGGVQGTHTAALAQVEAL